MPLLRETEVGVVIAPDDCCEGIRHVGNQALLLFVRRERPVVAVKESFQQVRPGHPVPVGVPGEIGDTHVPRSELEIDYARPNSIVGDQPIAWAVVSVTRNGPFAFEARDQVEGGMDSGDFSRTEATGLVGTIQAVYKMR